MPARLVASVVTKETLSVGVETVDGTFFSRGRKVIRQCTRAAKSGVLTMGDLPSLPGDFRCCRTGNSKP